MKLFKFLYISTLLWLLAACGPPAFKPCHPASKTVGIWYSTWYSVNNPNNPNFWSLWNIGYTPLLGQYDSSNTAIIDQHIESILNAGIDFVILDETDNLYVEKGFILSNALVFKSRIEYTNLKFVIAIGGMQFSNNPDTMDFEVSEVKRLFANSHNYMTIDGKPLIISYPHLSQSNRILANLATKYPDMYISWMHGKAQAGEMGWATPNGPIVNCDVMSIMPGWNNRHGEYVGRRDGAFYQESWNRILKVNPSMVVISSFNDFAEETAIESASGPWNFPNMYWNSTVKNIKEYKER